MLIQLLVHLTLTATAQDYSNEELEVLALTRAIDLGIERTYSEDGNNYWYTLPRDLKTPELWFDGAFAWRYIGQAVFKTKHSSTAPDWSQVPDAVYTSMDLDPDSYYGVGHQRRVDEYGRAWVLDSIDVDAAYNEIDAYNNAVERMFGREKSIAERTGIEYPLDAGSWRYSYPTSWTASDCNSDAVIHEIQEHSYDSLTQVSGALNSRQKKIVLIWGANANCSGTMVDDQWVLTAAHCTADNSGEYDVNLFTVCTLENLQSGAVCYSVAENKAYGNRYDGTIENDYALLKLNTPTSGIGWFALSESADNYIDNYEQYHRGYPGYTPSCAVNTITSNSLTIDDSYNGRDMYSADGTIQSTPTGYIKYDISSASGMSGGPIFYCPNGSGCDDGHYITGIESAYSLTWFAGSIIAGYQAGPKARDIRDWVINNTP